MRKKIRLDRDAVSMVLLALLAMLALLLSARMKAQAVDDEARTRLYAAEASTFREQCRAVGDRGLQWFRYHSFGVVYLRQFPCEMFGSSAEARQVDHAWLMSQRNKPYKVYVERKPKK